MLYYYLKQDLTVESKYFLYVKFLLEMHLTETRFIQNHPVLIFALL